MGWKIMEIERYQCETPAGDQVGPLFEEYREARSFALAQGLRVIAYQYEITDSELVDDFSRSTGEEDCDE